jgi:hypothetical protein
MANHNKKIANEIKAGFNGNTPMGSIGVLHWADHPGVKRRSTVKEARRDR